MADLDGSPTARYIYAGSQRIAMVDSSDNVYYYLNDHLGSAGVLITSTGTVRDKYKYKPFGDNNGSSIINGQSYRYTGKPLDEELDLDWYYYGARYYGPEIGRFLSVDPLNSKYPSWSPYVYTLNNPLKYVDPDGNSATATLWAAAAGAALVGGTAAYIQNPDQFEGLGDAIKQQIPKTQQAIKEHLVTTAITVAVVATAVNTLAKGGHTKGIQKIKRDDHEKADDRREREQKKKQDKKKKEQNKKKDKKNKKKSERRKKNKEKKEE